MILHHLGSVRLRALGGRRVKVREKVVKGRADGAAEHLAEQVGDPCRSSLRPAVVVVEKYERDVVPVLRRATLVGRGRLGQEEPGKTRYVDLDAVLDSTHPGHERLDYDILDRKPRAAKIDSTKGIASIELDGGLRRYIVEIREQLELDDRIRRHPVGVPAPGSGGVGNELGVP